MVPMKEETHVEEPLAGSTTNGDDEKLLLNSLTKKWQSHCVRGLKVRHEMGRLLNQHLGTPVERQPRGERILKLASERLSISESELSRMRWLAYLFEDFSSLKRLHDDCHSWTDFKRMLPQLKPTNGRTTAVPVASRSQPALRGVAKTIDRIVARFDQLDASPEVERCKKLLDELKLAVKACKDRTAIQVTTERSDMEANAPETVAAISA